MPPAFRKSDILSYRKDEDILKVLTEDFGRSEDKYESLKQSMESDLKKFWLIYDTSLDATVSEKASANPEEISSLKMPSARSHVETFLSIIIANLFPQHADWLHASPKAAYFSDSDIGLFDIAEMARQFRMSRLHENNSAFFSKFSQFVLQGLNTYWTVGYLRWHRTGDWVYTGDGSEQQENIIERAVEAAKRLVKGKKEVYDPDLGYKYYEVVEDRAEFEVISTFNGFPDPRGGSSFDRNAYFGDELRMSWHELYANQFDPKTNEGFGSGLYTNLDELWEKCGPTDEKTRDEQMQTNLGEKAATSAVPQEDAKGENADRNTIILRRYWTRNAMIIADKAFKVVIAKKRTDNWTKHLRKWQWGEDTTFHAQSLLRLLAPLDQEFDAIINHTLENWRRINSGTYFYFTGAIAPENRGKPALPGGRGIELLTPPKDAIFYDRPPDISPSTLQFISIIERAFESVSGLGQNTLGQYFTGGKRLATEVSYVNQAGANRQGQRIVQLERTVLDPLMEAWTILEIQQFQKSIPFMFRTAEGVEPEQITREWIVDHLKQVEFKCHGSIVVNERTMEAAGFLQAFNASAQNPMVAQIANWPWLFRQLWRKVGLETDVEEVVRPDMQDKYSIPPDMEYHLMMAGYDLNPHINDDDAFHLDEHTKQLEDEENRESRTVGRRDDVISKLVEHMEKTNQQIAQKQTVNVGGVPGAASPQLGQMLSPNTPGTQTADLMNPQQPGVGPPQDETGAVA